MRIPISYIESFTDSPEFDCYPSEKYLKNFLDEIPAPIGFVIPKREDSLINMSLLGASYFIPKQLNDIVNEILDSQDILKLEQDWDNDGANVITPEFYKEVADFLLLYSIYILKKFNIAIAAPEINPCRNGSIDLSWRTQEARMLINIRNQNNNSKAIFYGYHKSNNDPLEGVLQTKEVNADIASWMRKLK